MYEAIQIHTRARARTHTHTPETGGGGVILQLQTCKSVAAWPFGLFKDSVGQGRTGVPSVAFSLVISGKVNSFV